MIIKADLHIHSTTSDGTDTIEQIIDKAKEKGLHAIAITDHDTVSHIKGLPIRRDMLVLGGIEISAIHKDSGLRTHILGYKMNTPETLTELTLPLLEARNRNSEKQAEILMKQGYKINMDMLKRADGKYLYKQHIMEWLVTTEQVPDMFGEFYNSMFKNSGVCDFDIEYIDVFEAIRAIKNAGGLAVLAHPGQQHNFSLIPTLVEAGLDGIEYNHHSNSENDKEIIKNFATEYRLFLTGGSDYHGIYERMPVEIGDYLSEESGVKEICV